MVETKQGFVMMWQNGEVVFEHVDCYHGRASLSTSKVKDFADCPEWYARKHVFKTATTKVTSAMELGTTVHEELLLEAWERSWVVIPDEVLSKSKSRAGAAWDAFKAENAGKLLLKQNEVAAVECMVEAIVNHMEAARLLERNAIDAQLSEITLLADVEWAHGKSLQFRGRLDRLLADRIVDLKTTNDLSEKAMRYKPYDAGWDLQAAAYRRLVHAIKGVWLPVDFVVVESKEPHRVRVFSPRLETLETADERLHKYIADIGDRTERNWWHGESFLERNWF